MYTATTRQFEVQVEPQYDAERATLQSRTENRRYHFWTYRITIINHGKTAARLMTRHWTITDAGGNIQEVRSDGVVGEQPLIAPGESYEYTSGVPLATDNGFMKGSYAMMPDDGAMFDIEIPAFPLDPPGRKPLLN